MLKPNRIQIIVLVFMITFILNLQNSVAVGPCENPVISTVTGQVDYSSSTRCDEGNEVKWDYNFCNGYVNPNGSCEVKVTGGVGKIRWEIIGGSAYFDAQKTLTSIVTAEGVKSATVYLDNACGSIEIKATEITCNNSDAGFIKSSNGQWKSCPEPDTGTVKLSNKPIDEWLTWTVGNFRFFQWRTRCCEDAEDHGNTGCEWAQCPGQGMSSTTICADDYGSGSCEFGLCWHGSGGGREPGHMQYWECQ